ncbi:cupin domain-containing protein [Bradyrhizobium sp. RDI18]|uniref:cupin domain-containing protein n=1 Tax=Bradyrhizobium sp. RDI18 TaxID=3367400 RepID=UPI003716414C
MDIMVAIVTVPLEENLPRHVHRGEEVVYVLDGATLELPEWKPEAIPHWRRQATSVTYPTLGSRFAGDKALKMLTVHIVDKGKPVTELVK